MAIPTDSGLRPVPLRPVASPVDTFTQTGEGQQLAQLARGLQEFSPSLGRFASVMGQKEQAAQTAAGEQTARQLQEQRITYRDAVKKGLIKASDNPWFVVGARQQFGRAAAGEYAVALQGAVDADPNLQTTTNPADFDQFEADFRKKWMDENVGADNRDIHFENGFGAVADGYRLDEARRFTATVGARIEHRAGDALGTIVGTVLDQHFKEGVDTAASLINGELAHYLADNPKGGRIANIRATEAIADWARLNYRTVGRADVEALLRKIDAGPGSKLFGTHDAQVMLNDVEKDNLSMRGATAQLAYTEEQRTETEGAKAFWSSTSTALVEAAKNHTLAGMDLSPLLAQLNTISPNPNNAESLNNLRTGLLAARGNEQAYKEGLMWVYGVNPNRPGQLLTLPQLAAYAPAQDLTASQFGQLVNEIGQRDAQTEAGGGGSRLLNDNFYQAGVQNIRRTMLDEFGRNTAPDRAAAEAAVRDFTDSYLSGRAELDAAKGTAAKYDAVQHMADLALRLHAPKQVIDLLNKEHDTTKANQTAQSAFHDAMDRATEADLPQINRAYQEFHNRHDDKAPWSPATVALLYRLGVPLDDNGKSVKDFFRQWNLNNQ